MRASFVILLAISSGACPRSATRPDSGLPAARRLAPSGRGDVREAERISRRVVLPALLRIEVPSQSEGTAFACLRPGVGCTAKHVVGKDTHAFVTTRAGKKFRVPVLAVHPGDDVALLDLRKVPVKPLPVTLVDAPPEGTIICRLGYPPSKKVGAFVRCDPVGSMLLQSSGKNDGVVIPRLIHMGVGLKGDSGAPLLDPASRFVIGIHVSEANGSARAATSASIHDLLRLAAAKHKWLRRPCKNRRTRLPAGLTFALTCAGGTKRERANRFLRLGSWMIERGRRSEAMAACDEAIALEPERGDSWLWRSLVYPRSQHALDDAAFAFRLSPELRKEDRLKARFPQRHLATLLRLRDAVAPPGARLATLIADGACDACPAFCKAAREKSDVRVWAVEGANHPSAESFLTKRLKGSTGRVLLAIDDKTATGCGSLKP